MFRPSRDDHQGVLIHFVSGVRKYVSRCKYHVTEQRVVCCYVRDLQPDVYIWTQLTKRIGAPREWPYVG